ncbi:flavin reductase family protein [Prauserella cavernicola]|uniref:Flavin reductase family protein n=1 Tax=Prauserella cavernicola TaxID=2800127 RepID=A0A934V640_9PSEU|nr:flavin reductase family protein [Prauserella cavernicola]MBK1787137.1 flavin reductase family protein [Prauserella cavernicola]
MIAGAQRDDVGGRFREAMASFPSGVTIVTTADPVGRWWGFTATSFCSVSANPPLVLVCLSIGARSHPVFARATRWLVHVIDPADSDLALRFASKSTDKFADSGFIVDGQGLPSLERAVVRLECATHARHPGGDHTILVGRVEDAHLRSGTPAVYYQRGFRSLAG